mgnify:CR=1 FL=1
MNNKVNLKIDDVSIQVEEGKTVLEAARELNIHIPTLCHHEDLCVAGNCRVCVVEQKGARGLVASCAMPVSDGMEINTNSLKVRNARKHIIELLLQSTMKNVPLAIKMENVNCRIWLLNIK